MAKPKDTVRNDAMCRMYAASQNVEEVATHFGVSKSSVYNIWSNLPKERKEMYRESVSDTLKEAVETAVMCRVDADADKLVDFTNRLINSRILALERVEMVLEKMTQPKPRDLPVLLSALNTLNVIYSSTQSSSNADSSTNDFYESIKNRSVVNNIQINNYGKKEN